MVLVMAIPEDNLLSAREAFNDFFVDYLSNDDWLLSIDKSIMYQSISSPSELYVIACFQEDQYKTGFSADLETAANSHDPSFESFGAFAAVVEDARTYLSYIGLEPVPSDNSDEISD